MTLSDPKTQIIPVLSFVVLLHVFGTVQPGDRHRLRVLTKRHTIRVLTTVLSSIQFVLVQMNPVPKSVKCSVYMAELSCVQCVIVMGCSFTRRV